MDAESRQCPGCGSTLDYLYRDEENEQRIMNELGYALRRTYIPVRYWPLCWIAIWVAFFIALPSSGKVVGWGVHLTIITYFLIILQLLGMPILNWLVGMGCVNSRYMKYTKRLYVEDRVAFSRAGAFDLVFWVPIVCALLVYGYFWLTWSKFADIPTWRTPVGFIIVWLVTFIVAETVLCWFFFKVRAPTFRKRSL